MKLLIKETDYAVRALCYIAKDKDNIISARGLVRELKIPWPFIRGILQVLHKKGILVSFRGQGGGFKLAKRPENIFLVDLIKIFQGPIRLNDCIFKKKICPDNSNCTLKQRIDIIERNFISDLQDINIKSLM